jgi:DNA-binding MarR family transcriptional regulator
LTYVGFGREPVRGELERRHWSFLVSPLAAPGTMSAMSTRSPRLSRVPRVAYLVKSVERTLRMHLDEALAPCRVSTPEYTALSVLREREGLSSAQLARRVCITPQAMNQVVIGLERRGLIKRRGEAQGRKMSTSLTTKGAELLALCDRATLPIEERLLSGLSRAEIAGFRKALSSCAAALGENTASAEDGAARA